ncbi:hypothetical protein R1sor_027494 [Riccia sorocarpa]|uniref:Uncharacterized protein n=1 Tax=Riccia sorocarpa TaxID=122646 RepID=A0ABD3GI15_9MARC
MSITGFGDTAVFNESETISILVLGTFLAFVWAVLWILSTVLGLLGIVLWGVFTTVAHSFAAPNPAKPSDHEAEPSTWTCVESQLSVGSGSNLDASRRISASISSHVLRTSRARSRETHTSRFHNRRFGTDNLAYGELTFAAQNPASDHEAEPPTWTCVESQLSAGGDSNLNASRRVSASISSHILRISQTRSGVESQLSAGGGSNLNASRRLLSRVTSYAYLEQGLAWSLNSLLVVAVAVI